VNIIKNDVSHVRSFLSKKEDITVVNWLTSIDYGPQHSDYLSKRQPGTGEWFLVSETYQQWLKESPKTLFCPGIPGAGKTILTSIVIKDLEEKFDSGTTTAIAYVYCNFNRHYEQKTKDLVSSLLKQLVQSRPSLPQTVRNLYDLHIKKRTAPTLDELFETLQSVASTYSRVFIIIDALDECQTSGNCRTEFLSKLFALQTKMSVNMFATSRDIPEVTKIFESSLSIEIHAIQDDIDQYINGRITELPQFVTKRIDLKNKVIDSITKAVNGM
jgi:Cdc6-like AAA superfamily ATPase